MFSCHNLKGRSRRPGSSYVQDAGSPLSLPHLGLRLPGDSGSFDFVFRATAMTAMTASCDESHWNPPSFRFILSNATLHHLNILIIVIVTQVALLHILRMSPICCIVPNLILHKIASSPQASSHSRACAARSLIHSHNLHTGRRQLHNVRSATIVPTSIYKAIMGSDAVSEGKILLSQQPTPVDYPADKGAIQRPKNRHAARKPILKTFKGAAEMVPFTFRTPLAFRRDSAGCYTIASTLMKCPACGFSVKDKMPTISILAAV